MSVRPSFVSLLACAIILWLLSDHANAQAPAYYSNGRTIIPAPHINGTWNVDALGNTSFEASKRYSVPAPYGKSAPVDVTAKVGTRAGIKFAAKVLGALPVIGTGLALWEFFNGYGITPNGAGGYVYTPLEPLHVWQYDSGISFPTASAACQRVMALNPDPNFTFTHVGFASDGLSAGCYGTQENNGSTTENVLRGVVLRMDNPNAGGSGTPTPQTLDEVTDRMMADAGPRDDWKDALQDALERSEDDLPSDEAPEVGAGIDPVQGPSSTTTDGSGTSTTTRESTGTPIPGGIQWRETTTTTGPGGTTTTSEGDSSGENVAPPVDTPLPPIPSLYTRKFPDGIAGVWESRHASMQTTPIFTFLAQLAPSFGDGGCPVWAFPSGQVLGITVGGDLSVPCYVWAFIRLVMIISALLLARRLIFGG